MPAYEQNVIHPSPPSTLAGTLQHEARQQLKALTCKELLFWRVMQVLDELTKGSDCLVPDFWTRALPADFVAPADILLEYVKLKCTKFSAAAYDNSGLLSFVKSQPSDQQQQLILFQDGQG